MVPPWRSFGETIFLSTIFSLWLHETKFKTKQITKNNKNFQLFPFCRPENGPSQSYDRHTNGPETCPPNHIIVTRTALKRACDTSIYRALVTSAAANYKVSTYLSGRQQSRDDICIYGLYILFFSQAFFHVVNSLK